LEKEGERGFRSAGRERKAGLMVGRWCRTQSAPRGGAPAGETRRARLHPALPSCSNDSWTLVRRPACSVRQHEAAKQLERSGTRSRRCCSHLRRSKLEAGSGGPGGAQAASGERVCPKRGPARLRLRRALSPRSSSPASPSVRRGPSALRRPTSGRRACASRAQQRATRRRASTRSSMLESDSSAVHGGPGIRSQRTQRAEHRCPPTARSRTEPAVGPASPSSSPWGLRVWMERVVRSRVASPRSGPREGRAEPRRAGRGDFAVRRQQQSLSRV